MRRSGPSTQFALSSDGRVFERLSRDTPSDTSRRDDRSSRRAWVTGSPLERRGLALPGMSKCYLTFDAEFKWTQDTTDFVPVMSGGLLAISKRWWDQLGGLDPDMRGWGGENIDQSLRIWRCGGEIVSAPTSYVAHMWRDPNKPQTRSKYVVPPNSKNTNIVLPSRVPLSPAGGPGARRKDGPRRARRRLTWETGSRPRRSSSIRTSSL